MTFENLMKNLTDSMRQQNRVKKAVIADIVTCTKNMAIEKKCKDNITEEIVDAAILKCKKTCQEQIDTCPANRTDLLDMYKEIQEDIVDGDLEESDKPKVSMKKIQSI